MCEKLPDHRALNLKHLQPGSWKLTWDLAQRVNVCPVDSSATFIFEGWADRWDFAEFDWSSFEVELVIFIYFLSACFLINSCCLWKCSSMFAWLKLTVALSQRWNAHWESSQLNFTAVKTVWLTVVFFLTSKDRWWPNSTDIVCFYIAF